MSPEKRTLGRSIRLSADMSGGDDQPTIAINCPAVVFMNDAGPNGLAGTSRNGGEVRRLASDPDRPRYGRGGTGGPGDLHGASLRHRHGQLVPGANADGTRAVCAMTFRCGRYSLRSAA